MGVLVGDVSDFWSRLFVRHALGGRFGCGSFGVTGRRRVEVVERCPVLSLLSFDRLWRRSDRFGGIEGWAMDIAALVFR